MTTLPASFQAWLQDLRAKCIEAKEDAAVIGGPKCPYCQTNLEVFWGKAAKRYRVDHSTHPCQLRFHTFAYGESREEAITNAETALKQHHETSLNHPAGRPVGVSGHHCN